MLTMFTLANVCEHFRETKEQSMNSPDLPRTGLDKSLKQFGAVGNRIYLNDFYFGEILQGRVFF